jgi:hypothetical protein
MKDNLTEITVTLNGPELKKFTLPAENVLQTGVNGFGVPFMVYMTRYTNIVHSHFILETPQQVQEKINKAVAKHQFLEA